MRAIVVGGSGMLGSDVQAELARRGHSVVAPSRAALDITDPNSVASWPWSSGDWCVNAAAYTNVDEAETDVRGATELNAIAPSYLGRACAMAGCRLLHISTDFVFDGASSTPYDEEAAPRPLCVYGLTKRQGEEAVLSASPTSIVVRTAWLYGPNGRSFPKSIIHAWKSGRALKVVADQVGSPTYTADLAATVAELMEREPGPGIYHAVGPEAMSWHELAVRTLGIYARRDGGDAPEVVPIATGDWPTAARRPPFSVLSTAKIAALGIAPMRPVDEALSELCDRLQGP